MSGKALAAGIAANPDDQEPVASAIPLTYFSNDPYFIFFPSLQRVPGPNSGTSIEFVARFLGQR